MNTDCRTAALAWLSSAGLAPEYLREVLEAEPDPERILMHFQSRGELPGERPLPEKIRRMLKKNCQSDQMSFWTGLIEKYQIKGMTVTGEDYPGRLLPLSESPAILFYQGSPAAADRPSAAMVGSRSASYKGLDAARRIAEHLSRNGIAIVSGLAYGIDAAAHQGCLKGGSPTIAILGCGLDQDYPQENALLRREILSRGGLVLSEYPPGEKPLGWHFPYRNRIISGMGDCLILMEARIRSGSMTSVQHALNQGRDVFVYPGEPGSPKSEGNHQLLREGAIYFTSAEDIMEDMGWLDKNNDVGQNSDHQAESAVRNSPAEEQVLHRLKDGEQGFDQLCEALNMPAAMLNATLSLLQIRGLIQALPGKLYRISDQAGNFA